MAVQLRQVQLLQISLKDRGMGSWIAKGRVGGREDADGVVICVELSDLAV